MEDNWKKDLVTDSYGNPVRSISNLRLIFTLDENLSQIRYDTFCQDDVCFSPLFRNVNGNKIDEESAGKIQDYLERTYRLHLTQNKVFEMLKTTSSERSFNPVQDFITQETWDGQPRIATPLLIIWERRTRRLSENRQNYGSWRLLLGFSPLVASLTTY